MTSRTYRSSRPCTWVEPRPRDARHMTHGKVLPMAEPETPSLALVAAIALATMLAAGAVAYAVFQLAEWLLTFGNPMGGA